MTNRRDPITWVIDWMVANESAVTEELALRCEREALVWWGGGKWEYFARIGPRERAVKLAQRAAAEQAVYRAALNSEAPIDEIARAHGMSRATLYRLIRRGPVGPSGA